MKRSTTIALLLFSVCLLLAFTYLSISPLSMGSSDSRTASTDAIKDKLKFTTSTLAPELSRKRLIFIGDVHGALLELDKLLEKVGYNETNDHLVFTGDLVVKGPDSVGVVRRVRDLGASSVMGNHDEKVARYWTLLNSMKKEGATVEDYIERGYKINVNNEHFKLAKEMDDELCQFLANLPIVIDIPEISAYVVHGGLLPDVAISDMDPYDILTMRNIRKDGTPTEAKNKGKPWTELWNAVQREMLSPRTVIYGHDSSRGLTIKQYSYGLDSGCVKGRKLTALIWGPKPETISVDCQQYLHD